MWDKNEDTHVSLEKLQLLSILYIYFNLLVENKSSINKKIAILGGKCDSCEETFISEGGGRWRKFEKHISPVGQVKL